MSRVGMVIAAVGSMESIPGYCLTDPAAERGLMTGRTVFDEGPAFGALKTDRNKDELSCEIYDNLVN
jgi:hypothetical protein